MKKIIFTALTCVCALLMLNAQITEESRVMVSGNQNAILVTLPDASSSFAEKTWKDFVKKYGKVKKVKKSNEWIVAGAQVLNIGGTQPVDIYARTEESGSASQLVMWVNLGEEFVNSDTQADAYEGCVELLENFEHRVRVDLIVIELEEQIKALDKLDSKMNKLKKDSDSYHSTIEKAKAQIAKAEDDIAKNLQDQELTSQELSAQTEIVEQVRKHLNETRAERGS